MAHLQDRVLHKAAEAFKQGDYQQAKRYYQQAATRYGQALFAHSIELCNRRLAGPGAPASPNLIDEQAPHNNQSTEALAKQLNETQALLEQYYTRCQALEYQLMDGNKPK